MSTFAAAALFASPAIIDVHRHAAWPYGDGEAVRQAQIAEMEDAGVTLAVVSITTREDVERWQGEEVLVGVALACPRNLAEPRYKCFPETEGWVDIDWLETQVALGRVDAIHEFGPSYYGISPSNPRLDPYWSLAARYDLPVGIHSQRGPRAGAPNSTRSDPNCCPDFDSEMGNPALLRPILERHPRLRIWLQHVGSGNADHPTFWTETLDLLRDYPNVYVDLSITNGAGPVERYEATLRTLIDAGFGHRIMFGSDNLPIGPILERLNSIEWLSEDQRRAILHDNAARFFRLGAHVRPA